MKSEQDKRRAQSLEHFPMAAEYSDANADTQWESGMACVRDHGIAV